MKVSVAIYLDFPVDWGLLIPSMATNGDHYISLPRSIGRHVSWEMGKNIRCHSTCLKIVSKPSKFGAPVFLSDSGSRSQTQDHHPSFMDAILRSEEAVKQPGSTWNCQKIRYPKKEASPVKLCQIACQIATDKDRAC